MRLEHHPPHPALLRDDRFVERVDASYLPAASRRVRIQMRVEIEGADECRVRQAEIDRGTRAGTTSEERERIAELEPLVPEPAGCRRRLPRSSRRPYAPAGRSGATRSRRKR